MKLKEYIENLQAIYAKEGDLELIYSKDDEGNYFSTVGQEATVMYCYNHGEIDPIHTNDIEEALEDDPDIKKFVCIN